MRNKYYGSCRTRAAGKKGMCLNGTYPFAFVFVIADVLCQIVLSANALHSRTRKTMDRMPTNRLESAPA